MPKISVNLIPKQRQEDWCKKSRIQFWLGSCGGYALLWVIALLVVKIIGIDDPVALAADVEKINNRSQEVETELSKLRSELERSNAELAASQKIGSQPDWSVLLSLMSSTLGDSIVLRKCLLLTDQSSDPVSSKRKRTTSLQRAGIAKKHDTGMGTVELQVGGLGLSQQDVSKFVLRLEQLEIFDQVKLVETRREPFLDGQAIAFNLTCFINSSEASSP